MGQQTGIIIAALILGLSVLGSAYQVSTSLDTTAQRLTEVETSVAAAGKAAAAKAQAAAAPAAAPPRRRGPDPDKVHRVSVAGAPRKGPVSAKVTLVEFSDFQCPYCGRVGTTLDQVEEAYPNDVSIVFKHMPLSFHTKAKPAHYAAEAAHRQGKFWEMHDLVFANQQELSEEKYLEYAGQLGLDLDQFQADLKSEEVQKRVDSDLAEASRLGVSGTPSFFINGRFFSGAKPFAEFKRMIDAELSEAG